MEFPSLPITVLINFSRSSKFYTYVGITNLIVSYIRVTTYIFINFQINPLEKIKNAPIHIRAFFKQYQ